MEDLVKITRYQEVPSDELMALQQFAQDGDDRIVRDLLFARPLFTELVTTKTGALEVTVGKGRLWRNGGAYPLRADTKLSATSLVPSSGKRIVLVIARADTDANAEPKPVRVLVNSNPREYVRETRPTRVERNCVVELLPGSAAASPSRPAIPAGALVVASFTLNASGVLSDVVMEEANEVVTLADDLDDNAALRAIIRKVMSQLNTLKTDLAGVSRDVRRKADLPDLREVQRDIITIRDRLDIPDTATTFGGDNFASANQTDLTRTTAIIEGGYAKFGQIERTSQLISLANPIEPKLDISASGLVLPKSTPTLRLEIDDRDTDLAIASYGVAAMTIKKKSLTRSYLYYAERAPYAEVENKLSELAAVRVLNPKTDAFETLDLSAVDWKLSSRPQGKTGGTPYWRIDVTKETWSVETQDVTVTGARIAQTFLCSQSGWHSRVGLWLTDVATSGDLHVAIVECDEDGEPDPTTTLARAVVAAADLKAGWLDVNFDPFVLSRGSRYAILLVTTGDHRVAISASNDLAQGVLFISTGGAYWDGQIDKDLCFRLYACRFNANRTVVDLGDIAMPGGIRQIAAILTGWQPAGTELKLRGRVGGVWRTFGRKDATILASAPTQIPLQLVFTGTKDLMPGIDLTASRVIASRPRASSDVVSTPFSTPPGSPSTGFKVTSRAVGFDPAIHTWTVSILSGTNFATETVFTISKPFDVPSGEAKKVFTIPLALPGGTPFLVKQTTGSSNPGRQFALDRYSWFQQ